MTRVAVITSVHQPFDARIFEREAKSLAAGGYHVTLLAPADFEHCTRDGIELVGIPRPSSRWLRPIVWWRLLRLLLRAEVQVIHMHDPELLLLVPVLRLLRRGRLRIVYDCHEYFVDSLSDKHWIPRLLRPTVMLLAGKLERHLSAMCDAVVCVVEGQREAFSHLETPVVVVRNLPRIESFSARKAHQAMGGEFFDLIYAGLILETRGIDVLLQSMKLLGDSGHRDIRLTLIGPETSPAYMSHLAEFVAGRGLSEMVRWLGYIPNSEVKHYLAGANVGLAPGKATRQNARPSLSTKILEYMISGLPVVCADIWHYGAGFVRESSSGLVVPASEPREMADAVLWMKRHPEKARAMGRRGRQMVVDKYSWTSEESNLLGLYETICQGL